ncbi:uncharacterized protein EI90DRAFT_3012896 [Cantharellus anzutake]|uniref:uncharacterized protein n=1 Tax=Cantharellus anzutake TaxID=1750568 RepID=UPI001904EE9F|nr:uncharacterized protein EI90DRAFT_3012896 [Cantharellus anzutake]KAF8340011.1 hypothetical protein EI90DRAFT_3012896 [Cantharellus anzutake]
MNGEDKGPALDGAGEIPERGKDTINLVVLSIVSQSRHIGERAGCQRTIGTGGVGLPILTLDVPMTPMAIQESNHNTSARRDEAEAEGERRVSGGRGKMGGNGTDCGLYQAVTKGQEKHILDCIVGVDLVPGPIKPKPRNSDDYKSFLNKMVSNLVSSIEFSGAQFQEYSDDGREFTAIDNTSNCISVHRIRWEPERRKIQGNGSDIEAIDNLQGLVEDHPQLENELTSWLAHAQWRKPDISGKPCLVHALRNVLLQMADEWRARDEEDGRDDNEQEDEEDEEEIIRWNRCLESNVTPIEQTSIGGVITIQRF